MTEPHYLHDAYAQKLTAQVTGVTDEGAVSTDRTIFYAESGGQLGDTGVLRWSGGEARIVDTTWLGKERILHHLEEGAPRPEVGDDVELQLDWDRRYGLMRHHTAVHVLSAVVGDRFRALFTGGQLYPDRARLDCEFEEWNPEMLKDIETAVNEALARELDVTHDTITRAEYESGKYSRLRDIGVDPAIQDIRLTIIGDPADPFDCQADGGTHVANTREVGRVVMDKAKNKGKGHRRLELHVEPQ